MTATVKVKATTITGDDSHEMEVASTALTSEVIQSFTSVFQLPQNVPWSFHRSDTGEFLVDGSQPIGSYVDGADRPGTLEVTLTPHPKAA
ncbi:MAG: hypothetical protein KJ726_09170 [Verrucomicrobia bacterium]|nr:hypothetical protein [Verrucomicrobiota bacterium]MBU1910207.1 hypothetical protein [Verrucomicrobiota bacterium]